MISKIDFIRGNTKKSLIKMYVPLLLAMTLTMAYSLVDSLWVGNILGADGMSALTASTATGHCWNMDWLFNESYFSLLDSDSHGTLCVSWLSTFILRNSSGML